MCCSTASKNVRQHLPHQIPCSTSDLMSKEIPYTPVYLQNGVASAVVFFLLPVQWLGTFETRELMGSRTGTRRTANVSNKNRGSKKDTCKAFWSFCLQDLAGSCRSCCARCECHWAVLCVAVPLHPVYLVCLYWALFCSTLPYERLHYPTLQLRVLSCY